jgi:uncharacterized UPF0160 family protein
LRRQAKGATGFAILATHSANFRKLLLRTIWAASRSYETAIDMEMSMTAFPKALIVAAAVFTLSAATASAAVVCNDEGDCWRVRGEPRFEHSLRLRVMPEDWRWKEGEHYRWREPGRGHGYWRGGTWIEIK